MAQKKLSDAPRIKRSDLPQPDPESNRRRFDEWHHRMVVADRRENAIRRGEIPPPVRHRLPVGVSQIDESMIQDELKALILEQAARSAWPLLFVGKVGRGKSTAAAWLALQSPAFKWMRFVDFCNRTHEVNKEGGVTYYDDFSRCCEFSRESWWRSFQITPLVVIDDLGAGSSGATRDEQDEALFSLLERRAGKPLVFTTNLNMDELQMRFTDRLISRFQLGAYLEFEGPDMRSQGFLERQFVVSVAAEH